MVTLRGSVYVLYLAIPYSTGVAMIVIFSVNTYAHPRRCGPGPLDFIHF